MLRTIVYFVWLSATAIKADPIEKCDDSNDTFGMCMVVDREDYKQDFPAKPYPLVVKEKVSIYDIPEFNADDKTITIFMKLVVYWNDTRITSDDPTE